MKPSNPPIRQNLTLQNFDAIFPDEDACKAFLVGKRWTDGVRCPRCDSAKVTTLKGFKFQCRQCDKNGYRFSPTVGTVFENTNIRLRMWFKVALLMAQAKKGISALQIQRTLGIGSYETAWYMCHRIRASMKDPFGPIGAGGVVEVDESYIGGKDRNRHKGKKSADMRKAAGFEPGTPRQPGEAIGYGKVGVIGAIARKGNVVAAVIGSMEARTKAHFVDRMVSERVNLVATDKDHSYNYVRRGMPHASVDHSKGEYVRGYVHTNTIESFWSLMKRGVMGSFHHVSKDYLPMYLNEFSFRFNHRNDPDIFGAIIAGC